MICKFMPQSCGHLRVVYRSNLFFDIDIEDVNFDAPQIEECINFHLRLFIEQFNRDSLQCEKQKQASLRIRDATCGCIC